MILLSGLVHSIFCTANYYQLQCKTTTYRTRLHYLVRVDDQVRARKLTLPYAAQANSPHIQTILTSLFQAHSEDRRAQELAFDVEVGDSELNNPYDKIVKHKLEHIFQLRGAVDFSPPLLMPSTDLYDEKARRPVRMLNRLGTPVQ